MLVTRAALCRCCASLGASLTCSTRSQREQTPRDEQRNGDVQTSEMSYGRNAVDVMQRKCNESGDDHDREHRQGCPAGVVPHSVPGKRHDRDAERDDKAGDGNLKVTDVVVEARVNARISAGVPPTCCGVSPSSTKPLTFRQMKTAPYTMRAIPATSTIQVPASIGVRRPSGELTPMRAARVPAEVMERVAALRKLQLADEPPVVGRRRIGVDDAERISPAILGDG
jgi:hypothetical protein